MANIRLQRRPGAAGRVARKVDVYGLTRLDLLRDAFVWAYERSCRRYVVVRDSVVESDLFRMK